MLTNVIGGFPYESIWLTSGAASDDICARDGIDVAEDISFVVGDIMACDYAVAMCPTVSSQIEACYSCRPIEWWSSSSRCCSRRSHGGRGGGSDGG